MLNVKLLYSKKTKLVKYLLNDSVFITSRFCVDSVTLDRTLKLRIIIPFVTLLSRIGFIVPLKKFF